MCLIAFSWNQHPNYKLILVANRDEFYKRKTQAAHFWEENPNILAGKDLEAGGTWMGFNKGGKFAALTNYRDIQNLKSVAPSRGDLTTQFLDKKLQPYDYLESIAENAYQYNGFNLLVSDLKEMYYFSNYQNQIRRLDAGLYGLSNHLLDTDWYKVVQLKAKLLEAIQSPEIDIATLLDVLHNPDKPEDAFVQQTGLSMDRERMLSSMFIESEDYGTCSSSVVLIDYSDRISFTERIYNTNDKQVNEQNFMFEVL